MVKLHFSPGACSMAVHIALNESGLEYSAEQVDLKTKRLSNGDDYKQVNPKGAVPALKLESGDVLTECAVILQYVADNPKSAKIGYSWEDPKRYKMMEWLNYISSELHKGFGPLFAADRIMPTPDSANQLREGTVNGLQPKFEYLNAALEGKEYLLGEFTVADAYLFTILNWTNFMKVDISSYQNLKAFMERMSKRENVVKTLKEEGLLN